MLKVDILTYFQVLHKAFIEVNEEGSEAAAGTAVIAKKKTGFGFQKPKTYAFRADHPFLFFIKDSRSGAILFLGRVLEPPIAVKTGKCDIM